MSQREAVRPPSTKPRPAGPPGLRLIHAVINTASGRAGPGAEAIMTALVAERGHDFVVECVGPADIEAAVKRAIAAGPDLLVILAGDGTARMAAELCGPDGPLLAPLPGGTMNMLPRALYGEASWQDALAAALDRGVERSISGGLVAGHAFYCAAILGAPALMGHAREALRAGHFVEAWRRFGFAMRRAFSGEIRFSLDGGSDRRSEALVLICPIVSKAMDEDSALEAAALDVHDAREVFRLAYNGLVGDWRGDPAVAVQPCTDGLAWARKTMPCILDGEVQRLPRKANIRFIPKAFRALAPPPASRGGG